MPYVGEIRMFGGNFAPVGWAFCHGQPVPIAENEALFNLIGTIYGGDGQETFHLPDLRGRLPVHKGQGPGVANHYAIGEQFGVEEVTLTIGQIPSHTHPLLASRSGGAAGAPAGKLIASPPTLTPYAAATPNRDLPSTVVEGNGGSHPHMNLMPTVTVSYIISLFGIYPSP